MSKSAVALLARSCSVPVRAGATAVERRNDRRGPGGDGDAHGGRHRRALPHRDRCDPVTLTAPAGAVTFNVDNARDDKAEFEILSATPKIVAEEFLDPGRHGSPRSSSWPATTT